MSFVATIGQRVRRDAPRAIRGVLAVGILLAVPAFGLTHFSSDLLASWQGGSGEQATLSAGGPLTFDAPASTVAQLQAREKDSASARERVDMPLELAVLLTDWQNTGLTNDQNIAIIAQFQQVLNTLVINEVNLDLGLIFFAPTFNVDVVLLLELQFNNVFTQEFLGILNITLQTPPTPASPMN